MSEIYVNAAWSGMNDGDSVTVEGKTYTIGTDAFASVAKAISSVADLDGKTIAFADDSSITPAAPFTTTYVTIDTRYATAGNIDGKTVTFTGNSNVSEVLWFDLNYKLPEADAQETVLKFENAYVYMTKLRPDYNSSVIVSGSTLDYSQGGQNGNIYAANTGVVTIQNNSKVLSLGQLSAYGTVNVDQSELHACSANGVKGSLNVTNGSTFTLSGIAIGSGGSVTIDNSTMVRKAVLTAFDDGNQSVLDWTANRELPRYRVNIGAYAGSAITGTGTMTVKNGATFDFSSAFAAEEYKNVTDANTSAAFVTVSAGSSLVIDGRDDAGKHNKVTFNVDKLINNGTVSISGEAAVTIATLDSAAYASSTMTVNGIDAAMTIGEATAIFTGLNFVITSDQLEAVRAGESRTLLTVTGSGNAPEMTFTVDGAALTANADGTFSSGDYVFKFDALGTDGIANDLVLVNTAPPITLSAGSTDLGGFETIAAAVAVMNADTANTAPYTITLHGTTTETQTGTLYFEKDLIISGVGTITASPQWFIGNANDANGVKVAANLTLADGADLKISYSVSDANLQGRHDRGGDAGKASTLTLNNARISGPKDMKWQGAITITGSGNKDADGNVIYGFKGSNDTNYTANLSAGQHLASQSRYPQTQGNVGLDMSKGAWLNIAGDYIMAEDNASIYKISDSKLVVGKNVDFISKGNELNISGDSVVAVKQLGYKNATADTVSAGTAVINVTGMQSEISADTISAAVTAINFTLTSTEIFSAGMGEVGDNVELFKLNNADAALDAATVLSITIDGAAYTLGDEIADDAGNKYVINWGALGDDGVANDLVATMTEKAPEPVIPEEPGSGGESDMEISAQNPPVFINPKYSEKSTGKKVNGVELEYGVNAFSSIEDAKAALGADAAVSMVMSKSVKFDSESDLSGISEIAGNSPVEKIRTTSATIKSTPKKSLTLNGTTAAATDFRQFSRVKVLNGANIGGDIINEKYTVKFKGTLDANGEWLDGVATTTNAAAGTLKVTDSTITNVFGFKTVKLTNSKAGDLSINPIIKDVATIEGGAVASTEIAKEKRVGSVTAKDSTIGNVMDYKTLKLQGESAAASIINVQNVTISGKADAQINELTDTANLNNKLTIGSKATLDADSLDFGAGNDKMTIGGKATLDADSLDFGAGNDKMTVGSKAIVDLGIANFGAGNDKMTIGSKATVYAESLDFGEGSDSLKISGTLVLENGMLEGIEKISGRGEIATTAAYADALEKRFDDIFGGEILDLGNTVANFRGTKNELADNTERKALKWNTADGDLGGWLGIGDDVDCIDSVDFVKITASRNGTLEISSADWSGSSDIVTLDGVKLDISGGSASFGITAGEDYLLKVERKDSNSMSYDIKLA